MGKQVVEERAWFVADMKLHGEQNRGPVALCGLVPQESQWWKPTMHQLSQAEAGLIRCCLDCLHLASDMSG